MRKVNNKKAVRYNRWGYIFLIPFFLVYIVFSFIPLVTTVYNGFFENFRSGFTQVGPNFVGLANYVKLISSGDLPDYFLNTMIMWVLGFIPQITLSLAIAAWLSDPQMKLKGTGFFKVVIYLPNLIMAASFAMLFFTMFSDNGPINSILMGIGMISKPFKFMSTKWSIRSLVGFMNFLMWTGHTTILLLASILGVDAQLFEAAEVDGATTFEIFRMVTIPLIKPVLVYTLITSMIGGLQMYDVPQILTNGKGDPMRTSMTLVMYLNNHLTGHNYGMAGALSVILFIITGILSLIVFKTLDRESKGVDD